MSLKESLSLEQQRLEKLWDAYEQQEKDLNAALDRITILEADIEAKGNLMASLQELLGERDAKLRELEVEIASLREQGPATNKFSILETPEVRGRQTTIVTTEPAADIMDSKSEESPYSRVEQLEKLIELRNKNEIKPEEFEEMKKEILGK